MAIINCEECGKEISDKAASCPNCGNIINAEPTPIVKPNKLIKSKKPKKEIKLSNILPIIIVAVAGVALAVIVGIAVRMIDGQTMINGETKLAQLQSELSSVSAELSSSKSQLESIKAQINSQSKKIKPLSEFYDKSLAGGTYTVGTDIEPGIYHLTYNLRDPDDDWGDYIYITYAGSEGTEETLGGTKFDYRIEAEKDGEQVSIKLDSGSKVVVESEYGLWNPGKQTTAQ